MDGLTELNGIWLDENQMEVNLSLKWNKLSKLT